MPLDTGVPQGSVLGPILFISFTSPIQFVNSQFKVDQQQYADDTQVFISLSKSNSSNRVSRLETALVHLTSWFFHKEWSCFKSWKVRGHPHRHSSSPPNWLHTRWLVPDSSRPTQSCMACRSFWPLSCSVNKTCWPASFCERIVWAVSDHCSVNFTGCQWHRRSSLKIATLTHKILSTGTPSYLSSLLNHYQPTRQLRSSSSNHLVQPPSKTKFGSFVFHTAAPSIYKPMSGHHLPFRLSRKCSKFIISAALPPRSRAIPAPQIRFGWAKRTLSLWPWRVFQIVIIYYIKEPKSVFSSDEKRPDGVSLIPWRVGSSGVARAPQAPRSRKGGRGAEGVRQGPVRKK